MEDFEKELKIGFLEEASQGIADAEQCFLSLESDPSNEELLNRIFRLAHNLKGSSKAVGFEQMGAFTHEFETFILKIKNGALPSSPAVINLLLRCNDFLGKMVETLKGDLDATFDIDPLIAELQSPQIETAPEPAPEEPAIEAPAEAEQQAAEVARPALELVSSQIESNPDPVRKETPSAAGAKSAAADESIRVSVSKVETLLNYVGEMVILQSVIREQANATQALSLIKSLHYLEKVTKEIQELSMSLRMVPVKPTFHKMQRIVRDTAQALHKSVSIRLVGEETELDKTVLERINDPLVHLVRNSVDHGIESAETRVSRGKPATGHVTLSAYHKSGQLILEVSDDGGGLDPEKLVNKAVEKGILRPGTRLSDREAFNLIFAPGFSTKDVVTDVSGRGVGMDVVRTNIQELSGEIQIFSQLGKGTTFRIVLPLTLAIVEGMLLRYGEDRYVIPSSHVHETLRPTTAMIQATTALGPILMLRGENLPLFKLGDFFGKKSQLSPEEMIAMVIRTGPKPFAILVDDITGQSQVVVKQMGSELRGVPGISGCTILGDGRPALILEPVELTHIKTKPVSPLKQGGVR